MSSLPGQADNPEQQAGSRGMKAVLKKVRPPRHGDPQLQAIIRQIKSRRPKADVKLIERAFEIAAAAHLGQLRKSGDPFFVHPLGVAKILADIGMDELSVAAALLHDAVEDTK